MTYYKVNTTWESFSHWLNKTFAPNDQRIGIWREQAAPLARVQIYFTLTDPNLIDGFEGWEIAELPKAADNPEWIYVGNRGLFPGPLD